MNSAGLYEETQGSLGLQSQMTGLISLLSAVPANTMDMVFIPSRIHVACAAEGQAHICRLVVCVYIHRKIFVQILCLQ